MSLPKISTITSCYKMERYLPLFLEQLPLQTMFDSLQVVLDHNQPTSGEIQLVEAFLQKYPGKIKHIVRENVVPLYTAWNNCVKEADADILAVWNVDDLRTPDSLERQYLALQDPEVGVAYGGFHVVRTFGECEGYFLDCAGFSQAEHTRTMRAGPFFMFRKSLCETAGYFDEQFKSSADYDFCVRLALQTKFQHVPANLGYYLNEGLGLSTRPNSPQPLEDVAIALRYGIYDKVDYALLPRANAYVVPNLLSQGKWSPVSSLVPHYDALLEARGRTVLECIGNYYLHERRKAITCNIRRVARNILGENIYSLLKKVWRKVNP